MPYHRALIPGLAVALLLNVTSFAAAQGDRGTITGSITDSSGGVVANASV